MTISGATDPVFAGHVAKFQALTTGTDQSGDADLPIGADGRFSLTWTPPFAGRYELRLVVPVEWRPDHITLRRQTWEGHVRG